MTTLKNPMELVDRYLQAVRFWLPKSRRQEDLLAELGEDLRSQIEAREEELGRGLDQNEVGEILKRCGSPMAVAGRLGPQLYLIGPSLFPIYAFVLRMVLLWIMVPVFVFIIVPVNFANSGSWGTAIAATIANLWSAIFISAGIITLVFALIERTHAIDASRCKWDPASLPPLQKAERKNSFVHTFSELAFNVFGFVWLLLVPHHLWMIFGPAASFLKPAPMMHAFYLPIVLLSGAAIVRLAVALVRPHWTWFPPTAQLLQSVFTLILVNYVINAAGQVHGTGWYPFVMLTEAVRDSANYARIAAVVNVSIMISLVATWFGTCIAGTVQTWQLLKRVRNQISHAHEPASLQVR